MSTAILNDTTNDSVQNVPVIENFDEVTEASEASSGGETSELNNETSEVNNGGETSEENGEDDQQNMIILMFDCTTKRVQDIQVGDLLMGDDSKPRKVLSVSKGRETLYRITPLKGNSYVVNESHMLSMIFSSDNTFNGIKYQKGDVIGLSVKDFLELPAWW